MGQKTGATSAARRVRRRANCCLVRTLRIAAVLHRLYSIITRYAVADPTNTLVAAPPSLSWPVLCLRDGLALFIRSVLPEHFSAAALSTRRRSRRRGAGVPCRNDSHVVPPSRPSSLSHELAPASQGRHLCHLAAYSVYLSGWRPQPGRFVSPHSGRAARRGVAPADARVDAGAQVAPVRHPRCSR